MGDGKRNLLYDKIGCQNVPLPKISLCLYQVIDKWERYTSMTPRKSL